MHPLPSTCGLWMCPRAYFLLPYRKHAGIPLRYGLFPRSPSFLSPQSILLPALSCPFNSARWSLPCYLSGCCNVWFSLPHALSWLVSMASKFVSPYLRSPNPSFWKVSSLSIISFVLAKLLLLYHEALLLSFCIFINSYQYVWNVTKMSVFQHLFTRNKTHLLAMA